MVLGLLFALSIPAFADAMDQKTVESVMQEIQKSQNVTDVKQIDIEKVTPDQLDQLGDVVMGKLIGDNERHEWMDGMIGGDGSEPLKNYHMNLGYSYLKGEPLNLQSMMMGGQYFRDGNDSNRYSEYGMMGFGKGYGMMYSPWYGIGGVMMGLLILILVGGAVFLFTRKTVGNSPGYRSNTALDILKHRYAKGEITHDEFEVIKKNLVQ